MRTTVEEGQARHHTVLSRQCVLFFNGATPHPASHSNGKLGPSLFEVAPAKCGHRYGGTLDPAIPTSIGVDVYLVISTSTTTVRVQRRIDFEPASPPAMANPPGADGPLTLFGERDPVFRPWPLPPKKPSDIADFVSRLKAQGIEFRELSDEGLRKQIEQEKKDIAEGKTASDTKSKTKPAKSKAVGADETIDRPKGREEMIQRRDEIIVSLMNAVQSGAICLDLVSLLLSKDRPTQALQTLSNVRDKVGIGTLSAGRIANAAQAARALQLRSRGGAVSAADLQNLDETTRTNAERLLEHKTECVGWQLLAMDRASNMLDVAQKRLHTQMRREKRYWSEILAVQERGWCLSRVPGQRRVLRVKFGFSEAAPDLRPLGFAPMHRAKGKHVALDLSFLGPPAVIVLTLHKKNDKTEEVGRSHVPKRLPSHAALEDRILEARNTIFAKELWRELGREVRLLVSHDVAFRDNKIVFPAGEDTLGVLSLETLRLKPAAADDISTTPKLNDTAEVICTSLHLLLSHGHREHYNKRSQPAPPVDIAPSPPAYCMLRAIVSNLKYEMALKNIAQSVSQLCGILHGVGQTGSRFTLYERPITAPIINVPGSATGRGGAQPSASESLCLAFLTQREFSFEYLINEHTRILVRSRTYVAPVKVQYLVQLLPPQPGSGSVTVNPMLETFPPADVYSTLHDVVTYLQDATTHVLAVRALEIARQWEKKSAQQNGQESHDMPWSMATSGTKLWHTKSAAWTLQLSMVPVPGSETAKKDKAEDEEMKDAAVYQIDRLADDADSDLPIVQVDSPLEQPPPFELRVDASWPFDNSDAAVLKTWAWSVKSLQQSSGDSADFESIIEGCINGKNKPSLGAGVLGL